MSASRWRCSECGHGEHLFAYAQANAYGPLDTDGTLTRHDSVDDCFVWESSIACCIHADAVVEKHVDGHYVRWTQCERCKGAGDVSFGYYERRPCEDCRGEGGSWTTPTGVSR